MPSKKPTAMQTPFESNQTQNTTGETDTELGSYSIADTPEAQAYLNSPIDIDRGVDEAADLDRQRISNGYNNAFMGGVPGLFRNQAENADINASNRSYGYRRQAAERQRNDQMAERRKTLLPQTYQRRTKTTGTSTGKSSGFNSQIVQPQSGGLLNTVVGGGLGVVAAF